MKPVRYVYHMCGKGLRTYWGWVVKTSEYMGTDHYPW